MQNVLQYILPWADSVFDEKVGDVNGPMLAIGMSSYMALGKHWHIACLRAVELISMRLVFAPHMQNYAFIYIEQHSIANLLTN